MEARLVRHANSSALTDLTFPPTLHISDSMGISKCGDADALPEVCTECRCDHPNPDQPWSAPGHNTTANLLCPTHQSFECQTKCDMDSGQRSTGYSNSPDSVYLTEPPKLRRALAYMDLDEGDCAPDTCFQSCVTFHTSSENTTLMPGREQKQPCPQVHRWRARMCRALRQPHFNFLLPRRENRSSAGQRLARHNGLSNEVETYESATYSSEAQCIQEHLPSGDLFHQFKY